MSAPFFLAGVLHLLPLPAAPRSGPGFEQVRSRALRDAETLAAGGMRGLVVENLGDAPFAASRVSPHVGPMLARLAAEVRAAFPELVVGINVLRNDGLTALGAAAAADAHFIRVNVLVGATWTDQGLIQGEAHALLRYRRELGLEGRVRVAADVQVKHGVPAGATDLAEVARETARRGGADVLIVTGRATGAPAALDDLRCVRAAVPEAELWVGSGVDPEAVGALRGLCDGAIVGTALHEQGALDRPLDLARVRALVAAAAG
jgi:membrane complex biogenesis BtpA family protein